MTIKTHLFNESVRKIILVKHNPAMVSTSFR